MPIDAPEDATLGDLRVPGPPLQGTQGAGPLIEVPPERKLRPRLLRRLAGEYLSRGGSSSTVAAATVVEHDRIRALPSDSLDAFDRDLLLRRVRNEPAPQGVSGELAADSRGRATPPEDARDVLIPKPILGELAAEVEAAKEWSRGPDRFQLPLERRHGAEIPLRPGRW